MAALATRLTLCSWLLLTTLGGEVHNFQFSAEVIRLKQVRWLAQVTQLGNDRSVAPTWSSDFKSSAVPLSQNIREKQPPGTSWALSSWPTTYGSDRVRRGNVYLYLSYSQVSCLVLGQWLYHLSRHNKLLITLHSSKPEVYFYSVSQPLICQ